MRASVTARMLIFARLDDADDAGALDMCMDMCVNMCTDMCVDMCMEMCVDMYMDMPMPHEAR